MDVVVFACRQNAGRSQMAAAFFNALAAPDRARAVSAGTSPAEHVHPEVVAVMREATFDLSHARPQRLTAELAQEACLLVTMGCGEQCPYLPGVAMEDWAVADPHGQPLERVREIRNDVRERVGTLVRARGWAAVPLGRL